MSITWILLAAFATAYVLTWMLRRHAISARRLDVPNARSSHSVPTPRGGGLAIVAVVLICLPWIWRYGSLDTSAMVAWLGAGSAVALVGWLDDRRHVPFGWRLLVHFAAAGWAVLWLGGLPQLMIYGWNMDLGWTGHMLAALYLVWLLNLYNFMDGIDGMAGIETITVGLGGALLMWLAAPDISTWLVPIIVATATAGFLVWNFPAAHIFMGDSGSGFLGMAFGVLSLHAGWLSPELFWAWIILLGVFIIDATLTLLRRLIRGERIHEPHRLHAYQHAADRLDSHVPVSLGTGAINLIWLLPLAALVVLGTIDGLTGVLVAYTPLVVLTFWLGAGSAD